MKLIVGLGNPGEKYAGNRHNAGFMAVENLQISLQDQAGLGAWRVDKKFMGRIAVGKEIILLQPNTFMNKSGQSISKVLRFYKLKSEDLWVIHDDLDIALGQYKIQNGRGPKLHYGVESVEKELGTKDFWRVRVGVENRGVKGNRETRGEVYSLSNFSPDERRILAGVNSEIAVELIRMWYSNPYGSSNR